MNAEPIDELARMVQQARRIVFFTGAGMSTECGIPDFRSPGGFWTRNKPIAFQEFVASGETRLIAWRRFLEIRETVKHAAPGRGHRIAAGLVKQGKALGIITQNIDGLHVCDGLDPAAVIELHGNGTYAACLECFTRHELDWVETVISRTNAAPGCLSCGGIVKSATISFGQPMPEQAVADAKAMTLDADLFLAMGSSLQVYPAAGLPVLAAQNGTPLVIINREPTGLDGLARLVMHADIGDTLAAMHAKLGSRITVPPK